MPMLAAIGLRLLMHMRYGSPAIGGVKAAVVKDGSEAIGEGNKINIIQHS